MAQNEIEFDPASLSEIIENLNAGRSTDPDRPEVAFPPGESTFKARFFIDPAQRLFRPIVYYRFGKAKSLVPPPDVDDVIAKRYNTTGDWHLKPRRAILVYAAIYETNSPSKYFEPPLPMSQ